MTIGLYGPGMHQYILDEAELGSRVATSLDEENNAWDAPTMLLFLTMTDEDF